MNFISLQFYNIIIQYLLFIYFTFCVSLNKDVIIVLLTLHFLPQFRTTDYNLKEIKREIHYMGIVLILMNE